MVAVRVQPVAHEEGSAAARVCDSAHRRLATGAVTWKCEQRPALLPLFAVAAEQRTHLRHKFFRAAWP
jgi:hypothetical protein